MLGLRQGGAGALGFLATVMILVTVLFLTIRMVPLYLDDYAVSRVMASLDSQDEFEHVTLVQARDFLKKGFQTNGIELDDDEVRVRRQGHLLRITVDYQRRIHLLYNINLVLFFEHDWKSKPK